jgi:hypothetical protein
VKISIDNILKTIEQQSRLLAEKLFQQFAREAIVDVGDFLRKSAADLGRWTQELGRREIDRDQFKSLIRGQMDVAEMRSLKQAGLAQVRIDTFINGLFDIVVNAAFAAIP